AGVFREEFHRVLHVLGGVLPTILGDAFDRIRRLRHGMLAAGQVDTRGIPHVRRRRAERDVAAVVHFEAPRQRATLLWTAVRIGHFTGGTDYYCLVRVARLLVPLSFGFGQHVFGIPQFARAHHQHVRRHGDRVIEIAVFE